MSRLRERASIGLCLTALLLAWFCPAGAIAAEDPILCVPEGQFVPPPPAPRPTPLPTGLPRPVFEGATPPGLDPTLPVLVFVHGLHGSAASWGTPTAYYGKNDMYDTAYAAGYKTFLVSLWDAGGTAEHSVKNGALLEQQLDWIAQYWGVEKVNLVAHSKGGPDANVAAHFGAPIDTIVTLSGAHWGSPLADLAQTTWLEWLAELLGSNDPGTKFLQTACMELVREYLDNRPFNQSLSFYTVAGTGWGPALSSLAFGGLYLAGVCPGGDNDGLVCVDHAKHPWARDPQGAVTGEHRVVWDTQTGDYEVDHDGIRMGNNLLDFLWPWEPADCYVPIFESIEPYAGAFHQSAASRRDAPVEAAGAPARQSMILRGGPVGPGGSRARFPLEPGVERAHLRLLTTSREVEVALVGPGGARRRLAPPIAAGSPIFPGAFVTSDVIDRPAAGDWEVEIASPGTGAFALLALLEAELEVGLRLQTGAAGRAVELRAPVGADAWMSIDIRRTSTGSATREIGRIDRAPTGSSGIGVSDPGIYNLSTTITGSHRGYPFERNAVLSFAVAPLPPARLPSVCE